MLERQSYCFYSTVGIQEMNKYCMQDLTLQASAQRSKRKAYGQPFNISTFMKIFLFIVLILTAGSVRGHGHAKTSCKARLAQNLAVVITPSQSMNWSLQVVPGYVGSNLKTPGQGELSLEFSGD